MESNHHERLDAATSRRLAELGRHDPDVSALERRLDAALQDKAEAAPQAPTDRGVPQTPPFQISRWLRPAASLAAVFAVAITLFIVAGVNTPKASAAVIDLSRLHHDLIAGRLALTPVQTVAQANHWIASQRADAPGLPGELAGTRVRSCCLANVQGEIVAVAVVENSGVMVTLVVAEAPHFAHQMGTRYEINGRTLYGHELDGTRMMMANDGDRWLCVMGDMTYQDLAELAAEINF